MLTRRDPHGSRKPTPLSVAVPCGIAPPASPRPLLPYHRVLTGAAGPRCGSGASSPAGRPRGRPKGTGLDDGAMLAAIGGLLSADPRLAPTTAIRRLGVTDQSTIRRLRDKHKRRRQEVATGRTE